MSSYLFIYARPPFLEPFKDSLEGVVVESTFNWYWLVDGLMEHEKGDVGSKTIFKVAQPSALQGLIRLNP